MNVPEAHRARSTDGLLHKTISAVTKKLTRGCYARSRLLRRRLLTSKTPPCACAESLSGCPGWPDSKGSPCNSWSASMASANAALEKIAHHPTQPYWYHVPPSSGQRSIQLAFALTPTCCDLAADRQDGATPAACGTTRNWRASSSMCPSMSAPRAYEPSCVSVCQVGHVETLVAMARSERFHQLLATHRDGC